MSEKITFRVEDMTCGHCEKAIRQALSEALPGAEVAVDRETHVVTVAGDAGKAEAAITEAGYTPVRVAA